MASKIQANADTELLLDCAFAHKADHMRTFLGQIGVAKSGIREVLRDRLCEYLEEDTKHPLVLTEYLNQIEGWGNQHIYLYKSQGGITGKWQSESYVTELLKRNGLTRMFNRARPVVLPPQITLASIEWTSQRVRFTWNEKREWFERREDKDYETTTDNLVFRGWERKTARGTLAFDWNLQSGEAMIMIQRLPTGTTYSQIRDEMVKWLSPLVDLSAFDVARVSPAINSILKSGEVRERRTRWETIEGGKATFTSASINKDIRADATLKKMQAVAAGDIQGSMANLYWLSKDGTALKSEFHTFLHRRDQRVSIMGEKLESEVRYVIGRIRAHCS